MSEVVAAPPPDSTEALGRAMYGSYLSSDYPAAMVLAERVLERNPEHALAKLVVDGCRERCSLSRESEPPQVVESSVVRWKHYPFDWVELVQQGDMNVDLASQAVVEHIDGVADVAMVAALAGVSRPVALGRIHAWLDLGLLEVVRN
jgi:hypothetical protein